ncbi:hypothetical protein [Aquibium carbonis]|uniref:hypothetical protein n=1 Tax=Aquibium carbonis TaxID=2495581 RepID=UPI0014791DEB|nr:hypothetical protein [Aquibium carbonis]
MIHIDPDVAKAAKMLEGNFELSKLHSIVLSLADLSPALWGRYLQTPVEQACLISAQPSPEAATL